MDEVTKNILQININRLKLMVKLLVFVLYLKEEIFHHLQEEIQDQEEDILLQDLEGYN